jgi:peroxin-14
MIEKNKETQSQSLADLQQELKSLKALLLSRGPGNIPSSPLPVLGRPTIPAWQLASTGQSNGTEGSSNASPPLPVVSHGKGKETEVVDEPLN